MFQLRDEHEKSFHDLALSSFVERAVSHLRKELSEVCSGFSDDQLRTRIRECIPRAAGYELTTEQQTVAFVDATFFAGEHFDSNPQCSWAPPLLREVNRAGDARAEMILAYAEMHYRQTSAARGVHIRR